MSTNFSGILSNFINTTSTSTDILSQCTIVSSSNIYTVSGSQNDGYFYLGNLLIQFSATTTNTSSNWHKYNFSPIQITFPITYTSQPYSVLITSCSTGNTNACIQTISSSGFTFLQQTTEGTVSWVAIGPRP
jgi:hypothetical protein